MENGMALHIEANEMWRRIVTDALENSTHAVIDYASDLSDALNKLDRVNSREIPANLIIVGDTGSPGNYDAQAIADRIEKLGLPVRTVGLGSRAMKALGVDVDLDINKHTMNKHGLRRGIDSLPEPAVS